MPLYRTLLPVSTCTCPPRPACRAKQPSATFLYRPLSRGCIGYTLIRASLRSQISSFRQDIGHFYGARGLGGFVGTLVCVGPAQTWRFVRRQGFDWLYSTELLDYDIHICFFGLLPWLPVMSVSIYLSALVPSCSHSSHHPTTCKHAS